MGVVYKLDEKGRFDAISEKHRHISVTYESYQVRVFKVPIYACFNWKLYGSKEKALEAAIQFRDKVTSILSLAGKVYRGNLSYGDKDSSRKIGVSLSKDRNGFFCFQASWTNSEGKRKTKAYSLNKYGEEKALSLAIEAREKGAGLFPEEALEEIQKLKEEIKQEQKLLRRRGTHETKSD